MDIPVGLNALTGILTREREKEIRSRYTGQGSVTEEDQIRRVQPQAKEHRKQETGFSLELLEGQQPHQHLDFRNLAPGNVM